MATVEPAVNITAGSAVLDAALDYATTYGWAVIPIHWVDDYGCSCRKDDCDNPGKHPAGTAHGFYDATTDPDTIREWWQAFPLANVGIRTGPPGPTVIDPDGPIGKHEWLKFIAGIGWAATPWVSSGGGGWHVYYLGDEEIGCKWGWLNKVDYKGRGGYVVAPPSVHENGNEYWWQHGPEERALAPMPSKVRDAILAPKPKIAKPSPRPVKVARAVGDRYAAKALDNEVERMRATVEGERNNTLNVCAFNLGQLVAVGDLDAGAVVGELLAAAESVGLTKSASKATIASGLQAGINNPRNR